MYKYLEVLPLTVRINRDYLEVGKSDFLSSGKCHSSYQFRQYVIFKFLSISKDNNFPYIDYNPGVTKFFKNSNNSIHWSRLLT